MIEKNINIINDEICKIYDNAIEKNLFEKEQLLTPWFYPSNIFNINAKILFVWMNPAWWKEDFYKWDEKNISKIEKIESIKKTINYKESEKPYKYYKEYIKNFPDLENWNQVDLFQYRCTNQKELESIIKSSIYKDFINSQYNIFVKLIKLINPKIIVITSARASHYLKEKWSISHIWENWFWLTPKKIIGKEIPVLFTSMLSWQRALDIWTREQLIWKINDILSNIK